MACVLVFVNEIKSNVKTVKIYRYLLLKNVKLNMFYTRVETFR